MGTDIECLFEWQTETGSWEPFLNLNPSDDDIQHYGYLRDDAREAGKPAPLFLLKYEDRNYNLFAILGNVRNGHGFAGIATGEGYQPLTDKRGVPKDASTEYRELVAAWGVDGHSHTWMTLAELLDPAWQTKTTILYASMVLADYLTWRVTRGPVPEGTPVWIEGGQIVTIPEDDAERTIAAGGTPKATHIRVKITVTYRESAKWFMEWVERHIVSQGPDPHRVRMVMFFV